MKKITFIRCLAFMVMLFTTTTGFSQTIFANLTPSNTTACPPAGCTANDVKIGEVYLADANGNRLTTCNSGDPISTQYLWVQITDASSKYGLYMQFNMYKGTQEIDENGANISDGNTNKITVGDNRQITPGNYRMMALPSYTCGDFITLKDIYLAWQTPPGGQATTVTPGCAGTSKCSAENLPNTIIVNTPLAVDYTYSKSCSTGSFEQITFTNKSTGGDGTLIYEWNFGAGATPSTSSASGNSPNPIIVTYSSSGTKTISLKITDRDGDTDTETKSIEVGTCCTIAINSINKTNITCYGGLNGTVTATKTGGTGTVTYDLLRSDTSGGTFSTSGLPTNGDSTGNYTGLGVGYYKVIASEANGCNVTSSEVQITQPSAALALAASSKTDAACYGASTGSVTAGTVTNAVGTVNYSWKNSSNVEVGTTATVNNLPAGTYTLTVTDNCSSQSNSVTISQPSAALALAASSKTDAACYGASTGSVTAGTVTNAVGTVNYSWKNADNSVVGTTATVNNLPAGTYTLTVTDNCSSQSNSVTISQPSAALALAASSKTDAACYGASTGSVTAGTVTNAVGTVNYSWKNADNSVVGTTATVNNLPAGTYTLTVTDNCSSQSNSVTISQPSAALALAASSKTDAACYGASTGSVTAGTVTNAVGTVNYSWKNAANSVVGTTATVNNLPAGTYTLTVTDNCSSQSNSVTISQPSAALALAASSKTDAACYGASTGSVTAGTVTNAVGTVNYSWKNAANSVVGTTATVNNLPAGTYTLTVTDNCSSQSNSVTISQPSAALALAASSKTDAACYGASTGSVTAGTVTNAVGTVNYSWKNSSNVEVGTTATVNNLPAGTYTLTVTDNCSSQSNSVTISQPSAALALAASSKTDAACYGASTGSVTAGTVTNAVGTVNYSWKNAANSVVGTTATVNNLPAGTYTLTVTDNCSSQSNSVTISQPSAALALAASSKTDAACYGASTGSVTAGTVTNAVGTVNYSWKNAANSVVGTTATVNNLPAGTYTLTVTDNCSSQSNSVTISQPSAALALAASSKTDAACYGASTGSVTAGTVTNAVGTVNYSWKNAANSVVGTTATVNNLPAGTYTLTVTDNCSSQSNSVTISQPNAALALAASSKTDAACYGASTGSVTAGTVTNAVGTVNYSWKNAANSVVGTTATVNNLPAGTYTLTVTDNCSSQSNSVTISQPSTALALAASSKTDAACYGASTGSVTAGTVTNAVGTVNYSWKNSSNVEVGTTATVNNLPAGTYTLTVTDNCSSQSNSVTISQPSAALALAASSKTDAACYGASTGSVTAGTVTNAVGTVNYSWKNAANSVVGTTATVNNLPAGTYTLTVTDNCSSQSNSVTISQPSAALALAASSKTDAACYGASTGSVTAGTVTNAVGTVNYSWKNADNSVIGTTATVNNLPAGTYTLTVTDNCSSQSNSVTITQPAAALTATASNQVNVSCKGGNDGSVVITPAGGTAGYTITPAQTGLTAGLHTFTVTDSKGCSTTVDITITEPANALTATASNQVNVSCKGGNDGSIVITPSGGTSGYTITPAQTGLTAGLHTFTVTDSKGCSTTVDVTITEPANALTATASNQVNVSCKGGNDGSIVITPSGGTAGYTITPAQTGLTAGLHTFTVTDSKGCSTTVDVTITEPANALTATASNQVNVSCKGGNDGSIVITPSGGTAGYTITPAQTGLTAGLHTFTVTDSKGCSTTVDVTITEPANALTATASNQVNVSCKGGNDGSIVITPSGGTAGYTITPAQTGLTAGLNTFTVTDSKGCSTTVDVTITEPEVVVSVSGITTNASCFGQADGSIAITKSAGSTVVITNANNQVVSNTGLVAGTYTLTATAPGGNEGQTCTATAQVTITQPQVAVSVSGIATNASCFGQADGSIAITKSAGSTVVITNANNQVVSNTGLVAGTYTLTATAPGGNEGQTCTATAQITISQPQVAVSVSGIATNASCFGQADGSIAITKSAGSTVVITNANNQVVSNTGLVAGTYTLTATAPGGNEGQTCTATAQVTISQPQVAVSVSGIATNASCFGQADGSIAVTKSAGSTVVITNANNQVVSNTGLVAGTYTLTATAPGGNEGQTCTATAQVTITQPQVAISVSGIATNASCFGQADGSIAITKSAGSTVVITNANNQVVSNTGLVAGTYTLTATAPGGNEGQTCTATTQVIITQPQVAVSVSGIATNASCFGQADGSIAITKSAGSTVVITNANNQVVSNTGLVAGTYTLTATAPGGNEGQTCTATAQVTISQPQVAVSVSGIATNASCFGQADGSIAVTKSAGSTVVITNANNQVVSNTGLVAGTYTLTATAPGGNEGQTCTATAQVTITQPQVAISVSGIATNASCFGQADGSIAITKSAGSTVVITNTNNQVVSNTGLVAGTYTLTATAPGGNEGQTCTATAQITITQPQIAVSVSGIATNASCFGQADGSIAVTSSTGSTVVIKNANNQVVSNTGLVAGTYTLTATAPGGNQGQTCTATAQVTISQPQVAVSVSGIATNVSCFGEANGSIAVTKSAGSTVVITNANSQVVSNTGLVAGTYTLTATAPGGNQGQTCTATAQVTITQPNAALSATAIIVNNNNCVGCSNGSINLTVQGGTAPYSFSWSNGATTEDLNGLPKGTYTVTIKDKNNSCSIVKSYEINESGIEILKDARYVDSNEDNITNIGDIIVYEFEVKNIGNVTLTNVTITDNKANVIGGPIATLAPGASDKTTFSGVHTITQDDINKGYYYNLALTNAKDPENVTVTDTSSDPTPCTTCPKDPVCTDCTITVLPQTPGLVLDKTATVISHDTSSDVYSFVGDVINYTILVTNTGNVTINNIVVKDPLTGLDTTSEPFSLDPGKSKEFTQSYTITLNDLKVDSITNIATASGSTPNNTPIEAEDNVIVEKAGVLGCGTILVHNAFTPNNDDTNEVFKIDNIDDTICYPENSVEIYNRWGILVYEIKGYNNEDKAFKGFSEGRVTVDKGAGLPTGTYFYILNYTSVGLQGETIANKKQGYLYLTR